MAGAQGRVRLGLYAADLFAMREFDLSFSKVHARCGELNWGNYRLLITAANEEARRDYAEECRKSMKRQR